MESRLLPPTSPTHLRLMNIRVRQYREAGFSKWNPKENKHVL
jgi:hypothetical protein